jgi:tRNA pseudouridine(55) synthase
MFLYYKKRFQTCLQMLDEARHEFPQLEDEVLSYVGILDPMAEGWVGVLVGKEENRERLKYSQAVKEYVVKVLVGVSTDSGDLMGVVESCQLEVGSFQLGRNKVVNAVESFPEEFSQKVSRFANKKYLGKPLWWYKLHNVDVPEEALVERKVRILDREVMGIGEVSGEYLAGEIESMADVFGMSFRMDRVIPSWDVVFSDVQNTKFDVIQIRVVVSKGFFVREFVREISRRVGVPLVVLNLRRSKIFDLPLDVEISSY